jgi:hypothetical protein
VGLEFWRCITNRNSRTGEQFADYIRAALNLKGVDNFESDAQGKRYITFVGGLTQALQTAGIDPSAMRDGELYGLANDVATAARNKITPARDCLCRSEITVHDLTNKTQALVAEVQLLRSAGVQERSYTL